MKHGHFLHCRDCAELFRPSPHDRAAEYRMTADGYTQVLRDDCMAFLTSHARHRLETLRPTAPGVQTGALWDATTATYWEVSDGSRTFVVEGRRSQIGSPLRYRLRAGRLVTERVAVEISDEELRQEIDRALYPGVAPERKITAFIAAFKEVAWSLDPATLEIVYAVPGDPASSVARLSPTATAEVVARAGDIFDPAERRKIAARFEARDDETDAFTVLVRQRVRVEE